MEQGRLETQVNRTRNARLKEKIEEAIRHLAGRLFPAVPQPVPIPVRPDEFGRRIR